MILVCTLGTTWPVVAEAYAAVAPERCPLYQHQPKDLGLPEPAEVWVVTTSGTEGQHDLEAWWHRLGRPVPLRWFRTAAADGNAQAEVELIRELILRVVLKAGPDAVLCLSGGRKTMSADLQRAGMVFGCRAMLHVLPPNDPAGRLRNHDWATPLPADLTIQVVHVGSGQRSDLLDITPALSAVTHPVDEGLFPAPQILLWRDLDQREADGGRLLANFHAEVAREERHENWRSLYRLSPGQIHRLRQTPLGPQHRRWLQRLPKADLHCHLGGMLDLSEQIAVGQAVWESLTMAQRKQATQDADRWWRHPDRPGDERWATQDKIRRCHAAAVLLSQTDRDDLAEALWPPHGARVGLNEGHRWGFKAYEHPGSLVGSTILQTPAATWAYAEALLDRCRRDGLAYLEVRCSPQKYYPGFLDDLHRALTEDQEPDDPMVRIIVIVDRRDQPDTPAKDLIPPVIRLALDARERLGGVIVGLDMAGDEKRGDPAQLAEAFQDAFAACLPITIHAGEGQPAANIWKSAYHLHADRIGHGLTLADAPDLARKFRDRRICLELCPTSNREVVGYHDPDHPGSDQPYPLRRLMDLGVPLTLCTDNPGISRTTLADEYLTAARMSGLSCWEALALIKQAYLHAFLPAHEREALIKRIDSNLIHHLPLDLPCPTP